MKRYRTLPAVAAALAVSLFGAVSASADQPDVFGPFEYDAAFTFSACGFPAQVSLHGTFTNRGFVNPVRNINYIREEGTITNPASGATLVVKNSWTELGRPPAGPDEGGGTFVNRGLFSHIRVPGGGTVLIDAGYLHWRWPDGHIFVAHGNHQLEIEGDLAELCAALS
jgi:hypothetical protein